MLSLIEVCISHSACHTHNSAVTLKPLQQRQLRLFFLVEVADEDRRVVDIPCCSLHNLLSQLSPPIGENNLAGEVREDNLGCLW